MEQLLPQSQPKIKPIILLCQQENQLTESNYLKSFKLHLKPFKTVRNDTHQTRGSYSSYIELYRKILTRKESLSKLSYSFHDGNSFENIHFFSKIRNLPNLTSLDVQFYTESADSMPFEILFKSLTYLKGLVSFKIQLHYHHFADASLLPRLSQSLGRIKKLKNFSLSFFMCYNFEKAKICKLPKYLSHLKQIQSLELKFDRPTDLSDQDIINLASVLPKLPLLSHISLSFGGYGRTIPGSPFLKILNNIKNLPDIDLNFKDFSLLKEEAPGFLVEGLRQLDASSVQKLRLGVHRNPHFSSLCQTFPRFTSLNLLHLTLVGCEALTKDSISELCSALTHLTNLSSLALKIAYITKPTSVIGCVASALNSFSQLGHLKIDFGSDMQSGPEEIPQLAASLAELTCLKYLGLSFTHQKSFSDNVLEKFSQALQKMVQLKNLTINFSDAQEVTPQGVGFLAEGIAKMSGLSLLDLNFTNNQKINEDAIEKIAQALGQLPLLYSFNLRVFNCHTLKGNNMSFVSLFAVLKERSNIREVLLHIPYSKVNEQEVDDLQNKKMLANFWWY